MMIEEMKGSGNSDQRFLSINTKTGYAVYYKVRIVLRLEYIRWKKKIKNKRMATDMREKYWYDFDDL